MGEQSKERIWRLRFIRGAAPVIAAALLAGCTVELPAPQYPTAGIGSGGTYRPPPVSPPAPLYPPPASAEPEPQPPYADEPPPAVQHPWARTPAPVTQPDDPPAVAQSPQPAPAPEPYRPSPAVFDPPPLIDIEKSPPVTGVLPDDECVGAWRLCHFF